MKDVLKKYETFPAVTEAEWKDLYDITDYHLIMSDVIAYKAKRLNVESRKILHSN